MNFTKTVFPLFIMILFSISFQNCGNPSSGGAVQTETDTKKEKKKMAPSDLIPYIADCNILLGNGDYSRSLVGFEHKDFFYTMNDGTDWVVYKTPNSGTTSLTSSNTRSELRHKPEWLPKTGGKLTGTCKVMHVSTNGDARVAASYSVVVGQIHSHAGHKNEPLKICYKKFPGHKKGSLYWNYEINTQGENKGRWDFSTAVWGYDMSVVGAEPSTYPAEPKDGIELGEEFSYIVNVYKGIMYLTFTSEGHPNKMFTKNLIVSDFSKKSDMPQQTKALFGPIGQDGTEKPKAYAGEIQYFKQGAYNQTNGKDPKKNIVWCTGSETFGGDIPKQYENGSYTEVWFKEGSTGPGTPPVK